MAQGISCDMWATVPWKQNIIVLRICLSAPSEDQKVVGKCPFNAGGILYMQKSVADLICFLLQSIEVSNVNGIDENTVASAVECTACCGRDISNYHLHNEGKRDITEQTPEKFCDKLQQPLLLNKTSYSQISCSHSERMPKNLLKKIKKKRSQNSKPLKNLVKGKHEKDKTREPESSTGASERENCDVEYPLSLHIQPVSCGESILNSLILDEILSEKKRVILFNISHSLFI